MKKDIIYKGITITYYADCTKTRRYLVDVFPAETDPLGLHRYGFTALWRAKRFIDDVKTYFSRRE